MIFLFAALAVIVTVLLARVLPKQYVNVLAWAALVAAVAGFGVLVFTPYLNQEVAARVSIHPYLMVVLTWFFFVVSGALLIIAVLVKLKR